MSRSLFIRLAALLLVLAACTGETGATSTTVTPDDGTTTTQGEGETTTTQDAGGPVEGGTLVVAISSDPGHLNPAITTSGGTHTASELLYNGLVELSDEGEPVPGLAEDWEITEEGRVYTFTLRDDVVWHDGTPFTADDVVFSFNEVLLQYHSRTSASVGNAVESIEAPDDTTVVFTFTEPYAPLLQQLSVTEAPIVAKHVYEGSDPNENPANLEPIGTGPFRFVSYEPDSEIRLEKNPDYFKDGLPYLDEVVMRVIPEAGSQVIALEAGDVDWLWGVPGPDLERFQADDNYGLLRTGVNPGGQNCIMTVSFNLDQPMFQNRDVREALTHALDRQAFLERVLFNQGRVAEAPIHSGIGFAHGENLDMPAYDPDLAAQMLEDAGWVDQGDGTRAAQGVDGVADGTPLAFNFLHFPTFTAYGELFRSQLGEVGADVTLQPLEPPVFVETVFINRDFDTNIISFCNGTDPEIGVKRMYITSNIQPIPFSNSSAYSNENVDALFEQGAQTVDTEARSAIYQELQEILVEELPYFWIVETEGFRIHTAACTGFSASGHFAEAAWCDR
ncbi:MAG: ABC transporter substrate-binding protein [Actinobacteria bacterium]|nr:MAG: ABC transporter substrate-binding protein [Actinomycetota bacterium]